MLPKLVYSKIVQSLKKMKVNWDQDRIDNPKTVPYEIDMSLRSAIERHIRERHMHLSRQDMQRVVDETVEYLFNKGLIVKRPYGGHFFSLPEDTVLPTKEELVKQLNAAADKFFGKPKDFTDD